ncbi:MAG: hypothetical protein IT204_03675 [Fimbriimonadaceae bacterium]|nr:hypothetical protein [Fimbriimonadaceae bacterium]
MIWGLLWCLLAPPTGKVTASPEKLPLLLVESFGEGEPGPGWPRWGLPQGPAAGTVRLDTVRLKQGLGGRLRFAEAQRHVMLPLPEVELVGQPVALHLKLAGDRCGAALSVTVADADQEWFACQGLPITWRGWRDVRLNLTKVAESAGPRADGVPDPPLALLSLNLTFAGRADGELYCDELQVEQRLLPAPAWLGLDLFTLGGDGLTAPEQAPPRLRCTNRYHESLAAGLDWQLGEQRGHHDLSLLPQATTAVPLPRPLPGRQTLRLEVRSGAAQRVWERRLTGLPPCFAPQGWLAAGEVGAVDVADTGGVAAFARASVALAPWVLLGVPHRQGPAGGANLDLAGLQQGLLLAWAEGLQVVAASTPQVAGRSEPQVAAELERRCGHGLRAWLVRRLADEPPADYAARVAALRATVGAARLLLLEDGPPLPPGCARWILLDRRAVPPAVPGVPRACGRLQQLLLPAEPPPWLWAEQWPGAAWTGLPEPAASAVLAIACRAVPGLASAGAAGWAGAERPSAAYLAYAVAGRLVGDLPLQGIEALGPEQWLVTFADDQRRVRVAWSEGAAGELCPEPGEVARDWQGVQLAAGPLPLGNAPVYLLRRD